MSETNLWEQVDLYIEEKLIPADPVMDKILAANRLADLPPIDVTPSQGKLLRIYVQMIGAARVLEIGTLGGYSAVWMAGALRQGGKLVTLEADPRHAETARANFALAGLEDSIELRVGYALEQLEQLAKEGIEPFDLIFIDADKPNNPGYLQWALRFSHPGTVIIGDNVVRGGEIIDPHSTDPRVAGVRTFFDLLAGMPNISATAIQTVGSKGYDGFAIGIVTG
ncbi:O-methyltransferase [Paenibacillus haidiansis]|uniref:O-methyltransferase n=1 Tax=Paenibacillus haidiansis TaxID=1574488 RepID=UPI0039E11D11